MHDLALKWTSPPDWASATLSAPGVEIRSLPGLIQSFVSGDLEAWASASCMAARGIGAFGAATGDSYCVQVARDRLLAVSANDLQVAPGWHEAGFAITPVGAALHVFEARGASLAALSARAVTLPEEAGSPSAALVFGGVHAVVYSHDDTLRVHVDRSLAAYLWVWMEKTISNIANV